MKLLISALVLAASFFNGSASACEGKSVIVEDTFADDSGGWETDPAMKFENNAMVVTPTADSTVFRELNGAFLATDVDICVDVVWPDKMDNAPTYGVLFWAPNYRNHFLAQISSNKRASIHRYGNETWSQVWYADIPSIKDGKGDTNQLRVVAKENTITFYVNGLKVKTTKGQMPKVDTRFGMYLQRSKGAEGQVFRFKNFKATVPD